MLNVKSVPSLHPPACMRMQCPQNIARYTGQACLNDVQSTASVSDESIGHSWAAVIVKTMSWLQCTCNQCLAPLEMGCRPIGTGTPFGSCLDLGAVRGAKQWLDPRRALLTAHGHSDHSLACFVYNFSDCDLSVSHRDILSGGPQTWSRLALVRLIAFSAPLGCPETWRSRSLLLIGPYDCSIMAF
jgi:hypothetical protein